MSDTVSSDSEWDSDSGYGDDQYGLEFMYGGQAQSILSSLEQSIGRIDNFLSFERGFTHGDIVRSASDPSGQMGKVVDVHMLVDLENAYGDTIEDVNSGRLKKIRSISPGDFVVCESWVGRVGTVVDRVTVLCDDGAKCEVTTEDPENVLPVSSNIVDDSNYPYYPGQRVLIRCGNVSKSAQWLCGHGKETRNEGTICVIEAGQVSVDWFACAMFVCGFTSPPPASLQDSKNLTLMSCLSHAQWHIGDWCILSEPDVSDGMDGLMCYPSSSQSIKGCKALSGGLKDVDFTSNVGKTYVIASTKVKIDILWQDGSYSSGLESHSVIPVNVVNSHEFWPGQFVSETGSFEKFHGPKWGVVTAVDAKENTVGVNWKYASGKQVTETTSAYELMEHSDYKYSFGDLVFRPVHHEFAVRGHASSESTVAHIPVKNCGVDHSEYPEKCYLSCIGNVTGFRDGYVEVAWATGLTTKVEPSEICPLEKDDISIEVANAAYFEEQHASANEDKQSGFGTGEGILLHHNNAAGRCPKTILETTSFSIPQAAAGFLRSVASRLGFMSARKSPVGSDTVEDTSNEELLELLPSMTKTIFDSEMQASVEANILIQQITKTQEKDGIQPTLKIANPVTFRHFDMVSDSSDHQFLDGAGKVSATSQVTRDWLKKVQLEWTNLEKNLPETIYVRVFEDRMDLMRAVIVGAPGTPYHDGLFFFDIHLPAEFPNVPPLVHYHSGGLKLNPNLYESGKICLSLLNTWRGEKTEVWNPGKSTILQILLSLQAIVLNDNPYFNEAGFDQQIGSTEGEKNAVSYKENAFVLTCKSMLYLIRKPPQHFETFMLEHFTSHAPLILTACKAYMEGAPVGLAFDNLDELECSKGFKIMVAKLVPQLMEAFANNLGIDCSSFTSLDN